MGELTIQYGSWRLGGIGGALTDGRAFFWGGAAEVVDLRLPACQRAHSEDSPPQKSHLFLVHFHFHRLGMLPQLYPNLVRSDSFVTARARGSTSRPRHSTRKAPERTRGEASPAICRRAVAQSHGHLSSHASEPCSPHPALRAVCTVPRRRN